MLSRDNLCELLERIFVNHRTSFARAGTWFVTSTATQTLSVSSAHWRLQQPPTPQVHRSFSHVHDACVRSSDIPDPRHFARSRTLNAKVIRKDDALTDSLCFWHESQQPLWLGAKKELRCTDLRTGSMRLLHWRRPKHRKRTASTFAWQRRSICPWVPEQWRTMSKKQKQTLPIRKHVVACSFQHSPASLFSCSCKL